VFTAGAITSCKKKLTKTGAEVFNPDDLLAAGGVDTFSLQTFTVPRDSIVTKNQPYAVLGTMHDPKLGIMKASFVAQFDYEGTLTLPSGSVAIIDSVVLGLRYAGKYGTLDAQTFQVYEVQDQLYNDSNYYRSTTTAVMGSDLVLPSSATQTPDITNKPNVEDTTTPPQLRLKLSNSFGQEFIDDLIAGNAAFTNHDAFKTYFKGLRISTTATNPPKGSGAVLYFDLNSNYSYLNVYYHLQGSSAPNVLNLAVRNGCLDYNQVSVDYSGYHISQVLADSINGQSKFYTQAFTTQAKVNFPSVNDLSKKTLINQAVLYLPIEFNSFDKYYPSSVVSIGYKNDEGDIKVFRTVSYSNAQKALVVDVRDYLQQIVLGNAANRGLYLFATTSFNCTAERIVFNGPNTTNKAKPKLIIKYTTFN
jgi:hypothetical protein